VYKTLWQKLYNPLYTTRNLKSMKREEESIGDVVERLITKKMEAK